MPIRLIEVPTYRQYVSNEIRKLGRNHPFVRSQYFSEMIDAEGGMFTSERQALMRCTHERWVAPQNVSLRLSRACDGTRRQPNEQFSEKTAPSKVADFTSQSSSPPQCLCEEVYPERSEGPSDVAISSQRLTANSVFAFLIDVAGVDETATTDLSFRSSRASEGTRQGVEAISSIDPFQTEFWNQIQYSLMDIRERTYRKM